MKTRFVEGGRPSSALTEFVARALYPDFFDMSDEDREFRERMERERQEEARRLREIEQLDAEIAQLIQRKSELSRTGGDS